MPRYAWSDPYAPLRERLTGLADRLRARGARCAVFVDSNHHVDRDAAVRAGPRVLGAQHDGDRARRGVVRRARRDRHGRRARARRRARAARLRLLHALPRRLPDRRADRAGRARRDALPLDDDAGARADARGARGGARGPRLRLRHLPGRLPVERRARRAAAPTCPSTRARGSRSPTGSSCRTTSCWSATRTSTCPSAIRATCAATRSWRSATGRPRSASWRGATRTTRIRCCATPRAARSRSDEHADAVALGAREHRAAEDDVVRADAEVRDDDLTGGRGGAPSASQRPTGPSSARQPPKWAPR